MIGRPTALLMACALASANLRDPFVPPPVPGVAAATPLQRVEIDHLRLVALVYQPVVRALLEDDAGVGYVAVPGTPIGPRGGAVVGIERGRLRIREPAGPDEIVLTLRQSTEGGP